MTISTQDSKVNYQGNGQTTVFQIPFPFLENNQIYVQKKDSEGNLINYTYATDYTVTGAGEENGGSVTLNVAPEQGSTISIYRDVPLTQEVDYRENEIFPAETHEEALDKLTMEVQQLQEQLDRSIKVDRFSDVDLDIFVNAIERVYDSTDNIDTVANNINDVNTVADNIANVNTVAGDIDSVVTTATNINDVKTVAQNKASLNITAANINDIKTVSSIKDIVKTVADNNTNITAVGTNISSVNTAASNMAAIQYAPTAASNAAQSAANAANSARISANSAIWAEGTDAQVKALGGVHSSKGWAEQSTNANISLTNTPYTTNRILEIPQNIKLELNNGTLTLKAGSKVYVPNGFEVDGTTPKFDEFITSNDSVDTDFGNASKEVAFLMTKSDLANTMSVWSGKQVVSGTSAPDFSSAGYWGVWYDTSNNIIKIQDGTNEWKDLRGFSLPICLVSSSSSAVTSLDQVFNGFGYIGSTVFALPGVKVQIPNGRNEDGTCNNIIAVNDSVKLSTLSSSDNGDKGWYVSSTFTISVTGAWVFNYEKNCYINSEGNPRYAVKLAVGSVTLGKITSFEPFTVDSVANSNASNFSQAGRSYLSGLGMPSNRYIDLTVGASGSSYTASANGYFVVTATSTSASRAFVIFEKSHGICNGDHSYSAETGLRCFVPCQKGKSTSLIYGGATITGLWFVYAEGEQ